jgi:type IV secretory pathway TraG/TraD family ATPase VirD4
MGRLAPLLMGRRKREKNAERVHLGHEDSFFKREEYLSEEQMNHHVHIVGASGFGKTVLLSHIVKKAIESKKGLLFIDQKGDRDTVELFTRFVRDANRKDLKVFSLSPHDRSATYNILSNGSANELRDRIMQSFIWSEEFYQNQAASFLIRLLIGLVWLRENRGLKLDAGVILECMSNHKEIESYLGQIPLTQKREWELLDSARLFIKSTDQSKTLQGLRVQLESIVFSDFGAKLLCVDDGISLFHTVQNGGIVFMFLDTRRFGPTATAVGRFIIQDLKAVSARIDSEIEKHNRKPFTVVIDEFADLAQEDFISFLDRARSSKIGIVLAHQEISDLDRISPEFCGRLMGNTATMFAFLQKRPESAELISGIAGTRKVWKETKAMERMLGIEIDTGKRSKREVEEFVIHPNQIKSLRVGECIRISKYPNSTAKKIKVRMD